MRKGRGRPQHRYALTDKGLRLTGSNFTDLAMTLWTEIRSVENPEFRREMLRRIAHAMASKYANQVEGMTPAERLRSLGRFAGQAADFGLGGRFEFPSRSKHPFLPLPEFGRAGPFGLLDGADDVYRIGGRGGSTYPMPP